MRFLTYNIHGCRGTDGRCDASRIAEVIAQCDPDVIALQELDVGRARSGGVDQAHEIARHLDMKFHFHAAMRVEEEHYGNAVLTSRDMRVVKSGILPAPGEPRGALHVEISGDAGPVHVMTTHLGVMRGQRNHQLDRLLSANWIAGVPEDMPLVLMGDLNAIPFSSVYRRLSREMKDATHYRGRRGATFPSRFPMLRIDHIFMRGPVSSRGSEVYDSALTRLASDHRPLYADLEFKS
ncbi:endonuclease/exonuclease/phosphatase family protein [Nitratireductor basaltis]|uniref:endonuclease/exonuclease/phosphatase family protein n=1 Tax=Nitratireductor basaltis TaxID=472175 RepID=UPI001FCA58E6|nr:endonuclease/exonuclease/phosphatase family protein [Nitratireductor basaltis]